MAVAAPPHPPEGKPVDLDALEALIEEARRRARRRRMGYAGCAFAALVGSGIFLALHGGGGSTARSLQNEPSAVSPASASQRDASAWIAVARVYRGESHILLVDPLGRHAPRDLGAGWAPSWSPDRKRLAFTSRNDGAGRGLASGPTRIFVMKADGTGRHMLPTPSPEPHRFADWAPTWSPDGGRIAFTRTIWPGGRDHAACCLGESAIYVLDLVHGGLRRVSTPSGNEDLPTNATWSPDGQRIAYVAPTTRSYQVGGLSLGCTDLRVTNADSTGDHILAAASRSADARQACVPAGAPDWSPDGHWIAFGRPTHPSGLGGGDLYLISADGNHLHRLTHQRDVMNDSPTWSPDGRWVAFSFGPPSDSFGPGHGGSDRIRTIVVIDRSGGHRHTISRLRGHILGGPAW